MILYNYVNYARIKIMRVYKLMFEEAKFKKAINKTSFRNEYMVDGKLNKSKLYNHLIHPETSSISPRDMNIVYTFLLTSIPNNIFALQYHSQYGNNAQKLKDTIIYAMLNYVK